MESYDRLLPSQDTMPRGDFGNLIALPLQHEPRQRGNSLFIDKCFEPYADQWAFLASVSRIETNVCVQAEVARALLAHDIGVFVGPPAGLRYGAIMRRGSLPEGAIASGPTRR